MRPIKFRAWDKIDKRMWWNVQNAYDTLRNHSNPDPEVEEDAIFYPCCFGSVITDNNYELMQFTGLFDKNGKEIWEGDIVILSDETEYLLIDVVAWDDGAFRILRSSNLNQERARHWEVIGNVRENQELLK